MSDILSIHRAIVQMHSALEAQNKKFQNTIEIQSEDIKKQSDDIKLLKRKYEEAIDYKNQKENDPSNKEEIINTIHCKVSLITIEDFAEFIVEGRNKNWDLSRIDKFQINETIWYIFQLKIKNLIFYYYFSVQIYFIKYNIFFREILSNNWKEQTQDEDFDGTLLLTNEEIYEVCTFFEKLDCLRKLRINKKSPNSSYIGDSNERVYFISFLRTCIKGVEGLDLPCSKIVNRFSHLDFDIKVKVFSEILFDYLWLGISKFKDNDNLEYQIWDSKSNYII